MRFISPAFLGLIRGLGTAVLLAGLTYLGDASHLNGVVSVSVATVIAALALSLEHYIEGRTGNALFGAVTSR
jgi:hypothetical protein